MILQSIDIGRIIAVYVTQLSVSVIFFIIAIKILIRNRKYINLLFSCFYLSVSIGFIINAVYYPLKINPHVYILHIFTVFFVFFGQVLLLLFNFNLLKKNNKFSIKKQVFIILCYVILILAILILPDGITINKETNFRPVWSWTFLIILYIFLIFFLVIPNVILIIRLYRIFEDKNLKKKIKNFFIGACGIWIGLFGALLYITWDNPIFRLLWSFIGILIIIPFGLLMYFTIGREL